MASSDRRASMSPGERQRTKSQSSARSHRTVPSIIVNEDDIEQKKIHSPRSRQSNREGASAKRPDSSASNRSTTITSPTSSLSKKQRGSVKSSTPPIGTRRQRSSKRKKSTVSSIDTEKLQRTEPNDSEKQDLSTRGLAVVPMDIFEMTTLLRLILSNNNLACLPPNIGSLVNLEYLNVSNNPLIVKNGHDDYSCIPREFRQLKKLHTLIISECTLKHIPIAVWNTLSLQILDLSRNRIGYIVSDIGNLTDIRHLRLSRMDLDTLPPEIGFCDKLETIDLTGNPIDSLPETLIECRQIYELKVNYKTFYRLLDSYMLQLIDEGKIRSEHIPQVIFELENLRTLDLSSTKINTISNEHTLIHLTELNLSYNSFYEIPESLCTMEQLKILDISHNRIRFIPEYFYQMKQLEYLNLSFNQLTLLSRLFARLSVLKNLNVNHNKIERIDRDFSQSKSILTLDLSNNKLSNLPGHLCQLKQLETLDLRYNKLESLPSAILQMAGIKSMNTFDDTFHRIGLHLLGNAITEPPSYIWKSADIQTLFDYIEAKEKTLANNYYHLKLIFIGPKNTGKTTLAIKLVNNRKMVSNTRKTIDMYVSILQEKQLKTNQLEQQQRQASSDATLSSLTDHWIENRISTSGDYQYDQRLKIKRAYPPPIKTYRSTETSECILQKSTVITKNNFYFTIFDLANESSYEILYPLIYDSNALYILPINLTILLNIIQAAKSLENLDQMDDQSNPIDFDALITDDWLDSHIFHYVESISDYCKEVFIAILGVVDNSQVESTHQQRLIEEIHERVEAKNRRENIDFYSQFFPEPIRLDDENVSSVLINQFELIAQQWNLIHDKQKRQMVKQRLSFVRQDALIIDYDTFLRGFERQNLSEDEQQLNQMSFDEHLDYLNLIGDILYFGPQSNRLILLKPYYLLNEILSTTLFRPHIDQWLHYDDNMVFRFTGYYPSQTSFDIDRQRLLLRGEFTWNMLNVLFHEQNNKNISLTEQNILDYCYLMERLYLGYTNQSNLARHEFTTTYFVCPWLMNEKCSNIDYREYFQSLEREREYENLRCDRKRRIKQQQLWFPTENDQENHPYSYPIQTHEVMPIKIPDLPSKDQIKIRDSQIINGDLIIKIKIRNSKSTVLPNGLYERLLICLHSLFNERLDYSNLTLGRTIDRDLIELKHFDQDNEIHLTINQNLFERIENLLLHHLFLFYPNGNLRIET